jgi:3-oxoacyl-[acyl-carrier-protein] synthase II
MGEAANIIRRGDADVMITGGTEAGICELGMASFSVMKVLSTANDEPHKASRPFDAKRDGFVSSEGAGILVFEELGHAQARGATVLAELIGSSATADAYHIVAPCSDGDGAARCMKLALEDAGVGPEEIDYINAHGTSTPLNDAAETAGIKAALSEHAYQLPISSSKSMLGHALGASGALESIACVRTLQTGVIHPTINYEYPDPACDLDYVPNVPRNVDVRTVLKNSFGFGGQNACLLFRRYEAGAE